MNMISTSPSLSLHQHVLNLLHPPIYADDLLNLIMGEIIMSSSRPNPTAICILILEILLCIAIYLLCVCIRRRRCHRHRSTVQATVTISSTAPAQPRGLEPAVLASFPIIPYSALSGFTGGSQGRRLELDCAVCLSSFQDDETLRFIPKCEHVFHPQCVDPWFALHTTCPYCRANLATPNGSGPTNSDRPESSSAGEVVILVAVTNGVSGASAGSPECGRYTLRLPDEILRNFVPGNSSPLDNRSFAPEKAARRYADGDNRS